MRKLLLLLVFLLFSGSFAKTLVAVVETKADDGVLTNQEKRFLTDKLRSIANLVFSGNPNYNILTRENINVMLPPGKTLEECEGSCLAETGRLIAANYIAQAHVGKFSNKLSLTVEMYESNSGKLVSSFTGQSGDADGLLDEIENNAERFFRKVKKENDDFSGYDGRDGFSDITASSGYSRKREKSFIIQVNSDPDGALLSIDGDPVSNCKETPCKVQLSAGTHRFSVVMDRYFKVDSIVDISEGTTVNFHLKPKFGILKVYPFFPGVYESKGDVEVRIDGMRAEYGENILDPGSHTLEIEHPCYEPVSAKLNINVGGELTFNRSMELAQGGLKLSAIRDGEPVEENVYVDNRRAGTTPFDDAVPVCASISIGDKREDVPVSIRYHDEVSYTYEFEPEEPSYNYEPVNYSYSSSSSSSFRSFRDDYSYSSSSGSYSSSSRDYSDFYFQAVAGVGFDYPSEQGSVSGSGLNYTMDLYYAEAVFGIKNSSNVFFAVGAGLGAHGPRVFASSSSSTNYGNSKNLADEINDELPSMSLAVLLTLEGGVDFMLDSSSSFDASAGARLNVILSENPVISVGGFVEVFGWIGMELGLSVVNDNYMDASSVGVSFRLYLKFPGRPEM